MKANPYYSHSTESFAVEVNSASCTAKVCLAAFLLVASRGIVSAQPTILSTVPANLATVSPSAPVVITFSEPMDPDATSADFFVPPFTALTTTPAWTANNTILTCTPSPSFPASSSIIWTVSGQNPAGVALDGETGGFFFTSGGAGGLGTNAITTFSAGKLFLNEQTNSALPNPSEGAAYAFNASTSLSSNRTVSGITLTIPGGAQTNLSQFYTYAPYVTFAYAASSNTLESSYPQGDYIFNLTGTPANLQATVTLPIAMAQPNAPHISNFDAAQSLNAAQAFTLTWDPFKNGTANDFISVSVGDNDFQTPNIGTNGALNGTATSVTIPAGKLVANSNYFAQIVFYRFVTTSNASYATFAYRATGTQFEINTIGAAATPPVVNNVAWSGSAVSFDVGTSPGQALRVRYSTDCSLPIAQWQTLLTTNSSGTTLHLTLPPQAGPNGFFRVQNAP